jgi:hypothetical protein
MTDVEKLKDEEALADGNKVFRSLVTLQSLISILEGVFPNIGYSQSRGIVTAALQALNGAEGAATLLDLGALARVCVWENGLIKKTLHSDVAEELLAASSTQTEGTSQPAAGTSASSTQETSTGPKLESSASKVLDPNSPKTRNAKALRHVVSSIATSSHNFFSGRFIRSSYRAI